MLSINTDLQDILLRSTLDKSTLSLNDAIARMTTGSKVNHAKDNAAGYSIIEDLNTKISSMLQVQQNTEDGISLLTTAEGGLQEMQEQLERLRELTMQASTGTYDSSTRAKMQQEADSIIKEINRLRKTVEYDGMNLYYSKEVEPYMDRITSLLGENSPISNYVAPVSIPATHVTAVIDGSVELQAGEEKDVVIDGVNYKLKNLSTGVKTFEYSKDTSTKQLTITCNSLEIIGQSDVSHNIVLQGNSNRLTTGDCDDTVLATCNSSLSLITTGLGNDKISTEGTGAFEIYSGAGNDTLYLNAHTKNIHDDMGNDTYYISASFSQLIFDVVGDDIYNIEEGALISSIEDFQGRNTFNIKASNLAELNVSTNSHAGTMNTFYIYGDNNKIISSASRNMYVLLGNNNYCPVMANSYYVDGAGATGNYVGERAPYSGQLTDGTSGSTSIYGVSFSFSANPNCNVAQADRKLTYFLNPLTNTIEIIANGYDIIPSSNNYGKKIVLRGDNNRFGMTSGAGRFFDSEISLEYGENNQINLTGTCNSSIKIKSDNNIIRMLKYSYDNTLELTGSRNSFEITQSNFENANVYGTNNILNLSCQLGSQINLYGDSNTVAEQADSSMDSPNTVNINSSYNYVHLRGNPDYCFVNGDSNNVIINANIEDLNIIGNNNTINNSALTSLAGSKSMEYAINIIGNGNTVTSDYAANLSIVGVKNEFASTGDLSELNINGSSNEVLLDSDLAGFSTNANVTGNLNSLTLGDGINRTNILGDENFARGTGTNVYNVEGNVNWLCGGSGEDAFVINSGSQNIVTATDATTDIMINHGKDTLFSNVKDCTLNGYSLDVKVGLGSDKSAIINEEISFNTFGFDVDLSSQEAAKNSLIKIDDMLSTLSEQILSIGTSINRLEMALEEQNIKLENMISSRSTFKDADIAKESARYIKNQITQQASATLLSMTRNLRQENVLGLLYGIN